MSYLKHVRPKTSSSVHDVGWTSTLVLSMFLGYKLEATPIFLSGYKPFPINGCEKQTPNDVTSIAVMEVTSESFELVNRRSYYTNNCPR